MRASHILLFALVLLAGPVFAQQRGPFKQIGFRHHRCGCHECQQGGGKAAGSPPAATPPSMSPGQFVAPPPTGTVLGGSSSVGVEGMSLHIPEMTLKLPTLRMPSLFRIRKNPRMLLDPGSAPYVQQAPRTQALGAIPAYSIPNTPTNASPPSATPPSATPPSPSQKSWQRNPSQKTVGLSPETEHQTRQIEAKLQEREAQIDRMSQQIDRLERAMLRLAEAKRQQQPEAPQPALRQASASIPLEPRFLRPPHHSATSTQPRPAALLPPVAAQPVGSR